MREARLLMGMPITIAVAGDSEDVRTRIDDAFAQFADVDARFSTYRDTSEVSRLNRGELAAREASPELLEVLARAEEARIRTDGYFDIRRPEGGIDPSGIVKGWAVRRVAKRIADAGYVDYFVDAGGDVALSGLNEEGGPWRVGIRNPLNPDEIVKVVYPQDHGVATSGSYLRGAHIYNPHAPMKALTEIVSMTVIGPDLEQADVLATAAFAMGTAGSSFIEAQPGFESYAINADGVATMTSGWHAYEAS